MNRRVTVGDIASTTGCDMFTCRKKLVELSAICGASLNSSDSGEVVYTFPRSFKQIVVKRSIRHRLQKMTNIVLHSAGQLLRALFSVYLYFSVAVSTIAVVASLAALASGRSGSSASSEDKRKKKKNNDEGKSDMNTMQQPWRYEFGYRPIFRLSPWDGWGCGYYPNSNRVPTPISLNRNSSDFWGMNQIFSFVFGDSIDSIAEFDEWQYVKIAEKIRNQGGVILAEDLVTWLNPTQPPLPLCTMGGNGENLAAMGNAEPSSIYDEMILESNEQACHRAIFPLLLRFHGYPVVVPKDGCIAYVFPELIASAISPVSYSARDHQNETSVPIEKQIPLVCNNFNVWVPALGVFNLVLIYVGVELTKTPEVRSFYPILSSSWFQLLLLSFQVYALSFFAIPAVRSVCNSFRNQRICVRNRLRNSWGAYVAEMACVLGRRREGAKKLALAGGLWSNPES